MSDERKLEEIERDIEETRAKLADNLKELGHRVSPEGLKEEAAARLEDLTDTALRSTQQVAQTVTRKAEAMGGSVLERLQSKSLPLAVVGAALGLGYVLMRASRQEESVPRAGYSAELEGLETDRSVKPLLLASAALAGGALAGWALSREPLNRQTGSQRGVRSYEPPLLQPTDTVRTLRPVRRASDEPF